MIIETERLRLRPFEDRDRDAWAALNADPEVMRYFPDPLTRERADTIIDLIENLRRETGLCFLAAELKQSGACIGMIGLAAINPGLRSALRGEPEVEIGWRLAKEHWGLGLAPEGARACLAHAWNELKLPEVVAFTYTGNTPSQRVMEKIGMTRDPQGDFDHPQVPAGNPLRPHVLYRIANPGLL